MIELRIGLRQSWLIDLTETMCWPNILARFICPRTSEALNVCINVNGTVTLCCLLPNPVMDDLDRESFEKVWNGKNFSVFGSAEPIACAKCDLTRIRMAK